MGCIRHKCDSCDGTGLQERPVEVILKKKKELNKPEIEKYSIPDSPFKVENGKKEENYFTSASKAAKNLQNPSDEAIQALNENEDV